MGYKTWPKWRKVWFIAAIALFVAPYFFVIIYPSLSGTPATQALDTFKSSVGKLYAGLFLVIIIGYYIGWYSDRRKKSAQSVLPSQVS